MMPGPPPAAGASEGRGWEASRRSTRRMREAERPADPGGGGMAVRPCRSRATWGIAPQAERSQSVAAVHRSAPTRCSQDPARLQGLTIGPQGHAEGRVGIGPDTGARGGDPALVLAYASR
jgi:hypothetical protein